MPDPEAISTNGLSVALRPDFEWSQELVRRLNAAVMAGLEDDGRGEYRHEPVTVGGVYSPPEHPRLPALMGDLVSWLRTLYVLVFMELGSRRLHVSPTVHPDSAWVTQQARNLALGLDARSSPVRFLVRDRDTKFTGPFDTVLRSEGIRVIRTPVRAPNANAHAERVIETIRAECLDWTLIWGRRHVDRTLRTYPSTTTGSARAAPSPSLHRWQKLRSRSRSTRAMSADGTCSAA